MIEYRMDEIFELQMGKTPSRGKQEYWVSKGHKWISIADLSKCGKYISETKEYLSDEAVNESGISLIPANTVLLSFKLSIGKAAITAEPMYSNEAIMSFRDRQVVELLPEYIYYMFLGKDWDSSTNKAVMGKTLNKATLSAIRIKVHDISKQREIVRVLSKVDELIVARQQQLAKLDELVKARFVEIFGDLAAPDCLWLSVRLMDTCENQDAIKCGPFGTQLSKEEYKSDGVAVWEIPQINSQFVSSPTHYLTEEKAKQLQSYSICPGDIAMSRKGNVGKCAVFPKEFEPGIIHSDVLRIRVDQKRVLPVFMMYQLHFSKAVQHQIKLVSSGAIMAGINVTKLKKIYVHIPPMDLQRRFVAFVESVDKTKLSIQNGLEQVEILKKALMQKYFG